MYCKSYPLLYQAYKVILSLSLTQVACETIFSKLKYVKNRLRSQLSEDHLGSLLLMCVERDILARVSNDMVIDELVGGVVEWLKRRARDQHELGSKPTRAILLCPWERHFTAHSPAWWS